MSAKPLVFGLLSEYATSSQPKAIIGIQKSGLTTHTRAIENPPSAPRTPNVAPTPANTHPVTAIAIPPPTNPSVPRNRKSTQPEAAPIAPPRANDRPPGSVTLSTEPKNHGTNNPKHIHKKPIFLALARSHRPRQIQRIVKHARARTASKTTNFMSAFCPNVVVSASAETMGGQRVRNSEIGPRWNPPPLPARGSTASTGASQQRRRSRILDAVRSRLEERYGRGIAAAAECRDGLQQRTWLYLSLSPGASVRSVATPCAAPPWGAGHVLQHVVKLRKRMGKF